MASRRAPAATAATTRTTGSATTFQRLGPSAISASTASRPSATSTSTARSCCRASRCSSRPRPGRGGGSARARGLRARARPAPGSSRASRERVGAHACRARTACAGFARRCSGVRPASLPARPSSGRGAPCGSLEQPPLPVTRCGRGSTATTGSSRSRDLRRARSRSTIEPTHDVASAGRRGGARPRSGAVVAAHPR